jgi:hypothetical protein
MTYGLKQNTDEVGEPAERLMGMSKPCQYPFLNFDEEQLEKPKGNNSDNGRKCCSY